MLVINIQYISPRERTSNTRVHNHTHPDSLAFEELRRFLVNVWKRNESLNQVLWLW